MGLSNDPGTVKINANEVGTATITFEADVQEFPHNTVSWTKVTINVKVIDCDEKIGAKNAALMGALIIAALSAIAGYRTKNNWFYALSAGLVVLGGCYYIFSQPTEEISPMQEVENFDIEKVIAKSTDVYLNEAKTLKEKGDITAALNALLEANKLYPKTPDILLEIAKIYKENKTYDKAKVSHAKIKKGMLQRYTPKFLFSFCS